MFKKITKASVHLFEKWLPDPFVIAIALTFLVFVTACIATQQSPLDIAVGWGGSSGVWSIAEFAMQMTLGVVLGGAMASAKIVKNLFETIASLAKGKRSAIMLTAFLTGITSYAFWAVGLIGGALLAKAMARRIKDVDYRVLVAAAYTGYVFAGFGPSASPALRMSAGFPVGDNIYTVLADETMFHPMNLIMFATLLIVLPIVVYSMHPAKKEDTVIVDATMLGDEEEKVYTITTAANKIEHSKILWLVPIAMILTYLFNYYFVLISENGLVGILNGFNFNIMNLTLLLLGIIFHGDLKRYVDAIGKAAGGAAGIILQFPFYAGIMGIMTVTNPETGISLATIIADSVASIASETTLPLFTFLSAGFLNIFIPSGGGQWVVQGPIVIEAAQSMGVDLGSVTMACAWGDSWTNMIQPFWALPVLSIAKLSAKDIMGYMLMVTLTIGIVGSLGFLGWAMFF